MKTKQFFRGFLASLVLRNMSEIDTREGQHQLKFLHVISKVEPDELPLYCPDLKTGVIIEFDASLVYLQKECTEITPPYETVKITYSKKEAGEVVREFSLSDRSLISGAANAFISAP